MHIRTDQMGFKYSTALALGESRNRDDKDTCFKIRFHLCDLHLLYDTQVHNVVYILTSAHCKNVSALFLILGEVWHNSETWLGKHLIILKEVKLHKVISDNKNVVF